MSDTLSWLYACPFQECIVMFCTTKSFTTTICICQKVFKKNIRPKQDTGAATKNNTSVVAEHMVRQYEPSHEKMDLF